MSAHILQYDDTGSRKEMWMLLDRLTKRQRIAFVQWCGDQIVSNMVRIKVQVKNGIYTTNEAYEDIAAMHINWSLDLNATMAKLTEIVRTCPQPTAARP